MRVKTSHNVSRLVVKFGGSSLSSPRRVSKAARAVKQEVDAGTQVAVVVSAMGRMTDELLETVSASCANGLDADVDDVLSMGERTSARIFYTALSAQGVRSKYFDPHNDDWPIVTDDNFGDATPIVSACEHLIRRHVMPCLETGIVPVLPGFVGKTRNGMITTMGRGGSDITAFLLARCLQADESILVTSSRGLMTADPKLVRDAKPLSRISIRELMGLADSGTKFLKTKALRYLDDSFRVRIVSGDGDSLCSGGTVIEGSLPSGLSVELESRSPSSMVTITGKAISQNPKVVKEILARITSQRAKVLGFSANSNSLIVYVSRFRRSRLLKEIHSCVLAHPQATAMAVRDNLCLIRIVGTGLVETPGLIASVSEPLREASLNIFGIFTIASSIVLMVGWEHRDRALALVRKSLREREA